jgi:hypothetical protein
MFYRKSESKSRMESITYGCLFWSHSSSSTTFRGNIFSAYNGLVGVIDKSVLSHSVRKIVVSILGWANPDNLFSAKHTVLKNWLRVRIYQGVRAKTGWL